LNHCFISNLKRLHLADLKDFSPDRDAAVLSLGNAGAAKRDFQSGWLDELRLRFQFLSTNQRMLMGVGVAGLLLALGLVVTSGKSAQDYRVLFANVNEGDGAAIVTALQQMNVPYQFTEGGGAITVPQAVVYETRLKLAGQGLPKAGNVGFELLENQKFGTSQFVERVNYLRGLEGELARSVSSLGQVKSARVHLAVPKPSAFVREQERPTASVILTLHPGRVLDSAQTAAISRLVSSAVPGMRVQEVAIMDTEGGMLGSNALRQEGLDPSQLKYTAELEAALTRRLSSILEPVAGKDGFRAQVSVDLDFDERERTSETFGKNAPPTQTIRSQLSIDAGGARAGAGGVPGSLSNQPQAAAQAPITNDAAAQADGGARNLRAPGSVETGAAAGAEDNNFRNEKTVNYEVDRAIEKLKSSKGQLRRVSAAVVLDHKYDKGAKAPAVRKLAYTPEEIKQISSLAMDAIGFVKTRGDTVSVVNLPFSEEPVVTEEVSRLTPDLVSQLTRYGAIALGLLIAYFAVVRPLLRSAPQIKIDDDLPDTPTGRAAQRMREEIKEQDLNWSMEQEAKRAREQRVERELEAQMVRMREREVASKAKYEEVLAYAAQYAKTEPKDAALLLRAWLAEPASDQQERS
jgi:flagellar M-ring protein FliF